MDEVIKHDETIAIVNNIGENIFIADYERVIKTKVKTFQSFK